MDFQESMLRENVGAIPNKSKHMAMRTADQAPPRRPLQEYQAQVGAIQPQMVEHNTVQDIVYC